MLSGQYCTDHLSAKWLGGNGACSLPGCGYPLGDLEHLLSGRCAPLRETTILAVTRGLSVLSAFPILLEVINTVIKDEKIGQWISALIDPSTLLDVISIGQNTGVESIWPLFCF